MIVFKSVVNKYVGELEDNVSQLDIDLANDPELEFCYVSVAVCPAGVADLAHFTAYAAGEYYG